MRARLLDAHARERQNPWSLKHAAGGLMEIEFLVQTGTLYHGLAQRAAGPALPALVACGWIKAGEARALTEALALMQRLQQIERVALETPFEPALAGGGLRRAMARSCGVESFEALENRLKDLQAMAAQAAARVFGPG